MIDRKKYGNKLVQIDYKNVRIKIWIDLKKFFGYRNCYLSSFAKI